MSQMSLALEVPMENHGRIGLLFGSFVIALTAFLTVVDLFATKWILFLRSRVTTPSCCKWALRSTPAPWGWRSLDGAWPISASTSTAASAFWWR